MSQYGRIEQAQSFEYSRRVNKLMTDRDEVRTNISYL